MKKWLKESKSDKTSSGPTMQNLSLEELQDDHITSVPVKHFSTFALIGLSCSILNTWPASTQSLWVGMSAGGPVAVLYGTIAGTLGALTICLSLAEICHIMPVKAAQYYWVYALAPESMKGRKFLSYFTGWLGTAGWIALTSTAPYYVAQGVLVNIQMFHEDFNPGPWFIFIIYLALTVYATIVNIFGVRLMNAFNAASLFWTLVGAIVTFVTLMACSASRGTLQSGKFIFTAFINQTGWPDGIAWIMGLLQTQYALVGADGAAHVVDEIDNPARNAPIAIVLSCIIGGVSAFFVLISFLAATTDINSVISGEGGGYLLVYLQSTGSLAGTTVLSIISLATLLFTVPALMIASSRMIQSFAEDGCLPMHRRLGSLHIRHETPVWAILFNAAWLTIFGALTFGSSLALLAVQSSSVILLQASYLPVIIIMLFHGRKVINDSQRVRRMSLGRIGGPIVNFISICYILVTNIFFLLPSTLPVNSASLMNYAVVVVILTIVFAVLNWLAYARKHFSGPREETEITNIVEDTKNISEDNTVDHSKRVNVR